MKFKILAVILTLIPCGVYAATPAGAGRAGVRATPMARTAPKAKTVDLKKGKTVKTSDVEEKESNSSSSSSSSSSSASSESVDCREEYRECMDEFCLLDESEGERCICSDNIKQSKKIIQEIEQLQNDAEKLYSEGVERERLGAKAKYIFGDSDQAKESSQAQLLRTQELINRINSASVGTVFMFTEIKISQPELGTRTMPGDITVRIK